MNRSKQSSGCCSGEGTSIGNSSTTITIGSSSSSNGTEQEDDFRPLLIGGGGTKQPPKMNGSSFYSSSPLSRRGGMIACFVLIVVVGLWMCMYSQEGREGESTEHDIIRKHETSMDRDNDKEDTSSTGTSRPGPSLSSTMTDVPPLPRDGDYSVLGMRESFETAKQSLFTKLQLDYGDELFTQILTIVDSDLGIGRFALASPSQDDGHVGGISWDRMKRKLVMKLLQVQLAASSSTTTSSSTPRMIPFVWATGGHSAAAGHGNYFNESYTAVLEHALQNVFGAVGMSMTARNFAMGGTASGPEVALCLDAIFGTDIDVLSWDFGMTDGRNYAAFDLYFRHAGIHPNRPACVGLQIGRRDASRLDILRNLEQIGLTALYLSDSVYQKVVDLIPDSMGKSPQELEEELAPFVRHFKCEKGLEKGDICGENKYSLEHCAGRKYKTSWHPGWKWHALIGNLISLSLIDLLDDALKDLTAANVADPQALLNDLVAQEDKDYETFLNSEFSKQSQNMLPEQGAEDFDLGVILRNRGVCHTARLPAETRHKGILTESEMVGVTTFDTGMSRRQADQTVNDSDFIRLVYDEDQRQPCNEVQLNMDFRDYFLLRTAEGWKKLIVPNDAEVAAYRSGGEPLKGLISFSLGGCSWGKCPAGDIREDAIQSGLIEMKVNGVQVSDTINLQTNIFLRYKDGFYFEPNSEGRFVIEIQVRKPESYIRISSIMVW